VTGSEEARLPLSLDWEDWFQLCCPPFDEPSALDRFECRLPLATDRALELCGRLRATATWFCLVDQARRHPQVLRRIVDEGHRIGLHGLTHRRAFLSDRNDFRAGLETGRKTLEDLAGVSVLGFRAPEWSLRDAAADYWQVVREAGFLFDSSRAPLAVLGSPDWPRTSHQLEEGFWECPPPVAGRGIATVPLWGWGMRILPEGWLRSRIHELARRNAGTPLVLHPWELDEGQPPLPHCTLGHRFAHAAGLRGYAARLERILGGLRLVSLEESLGLPGDSGRV
jgi:polysaccharide deacetylase family protein (PEP-CTERM system associated)